MRKMDAPLPGDVANALCILVDVLLPGDDVFPSASSVGAHGVMAARLREVCGPEAPAALALAFISHGGLLEPIEAAKQIETKAPMLFETSLVALYYAYYETPLVIAAIRSLGHVYNDAPQPKGYTMRHFNPAIDLPARARGHFVASSEVSRVDLTSIDFVLSGSN